MFCIYLEESTPTATSKAHADAGPGTSRETTSAEIQQIVRRDFRAESSKFSAPDPSALKDGDDLAREADLMKGIAPWRDKTARP